MISNNKISNLVSTQLPFFVRNDHENFVAFLEAYYEFMETEYGATNVSRNMLDQSDIDMTDIFIQKFYDNFIPFIPKDTAVDKTLILKNIKDFYRARGTEKSIRFLMRVLFNEEVDFYYPQRDILRASDGKWFVEKSIKIRDIEVANVANDTAFVVNNFIGRKIVGTASNSYAIVENTSTYYEAGALVRELKISSQVGDFESGEKIFATFIENGREKFISANLFSGSIDSVTINNPGTGYQVGDSVVIESETGSGATIVVSSVSSGSLSTIAPFDGGAGFQVGNQILITGGGGSGANANVAAVTANGYFHPNTYNVSWTTVALEANTTIGNSRYSNLNSLITDPANNYIKNLFSYFTYSNTGPIESVLLYSSGSSYVTKPSATAQANTRIRNLGILGKMRIIDGGQGYNVNDTLVFENVIGGYGTGATGRVRAVNVSQSNTITEVEFTALPYEFVGGTGYDQFYLPKVNVVSATGQGASIVVTAVLGSGEDLRAGGSTAGAIQQLTIRTRGSGYETVPTLNLSGIGDGTAQATATIITGAYTYPGRYINDDGHLSSYNFIQNRDYYQSFSYVVKLTQSIEKYRQAMKYLIHPAGMKLFGEYLTVDENDSILINVKSLNEQTQVISTKDYQFANGNLMINYTNHNLLVGNVVYLDWYTGNVANIGIEKGPYKVKSVVNADNFTVFTTPYLPTQSNIRSLTGSSLSLRDLYVKSGGATVYIMNPASVTPFDLDRSYDVSTINYVAGRSSASFVGETSAHGFTMDSNGSFYYVVGEILRTVQQYSMTEKWNVQTSSLTTSLNLQSINATQYETIPTGIRFSPDGKNLYVIGTANDVVFQFNVGTPWYVNTANYVTKSIVVGEANPNSIVFSANGKLMYVTGTSGDIIRMFTLGTAWNVNTATLTTISPLLTDFNASYTTSRGIDISNDEKIFYIIEDTTKSILQLPTLVTSNANNIYYEINATGTVNVAKVII